MAWIGSKEPLAGIGKEAAESFSASIKESVQTAFDGMVKMVLIVSVLIAVLGILWRLPLIMSFFIQQQHLGYSYR